MTTATPQGFTLRLLFMLAGPLVWFAQLSFIYGAVSFGGAFGLAAADTRALAWAATGFACAAVVFVLWRAAHDFIPKTLALLSLLAILFEALVLWFVPA